MKKKVWEGVLPGLKCVCLRSSLDKYVCRQKKSQENSKVLSFWTIKMSLLSRHSHDCANFLVIFIFNIICILFFLSVSFLFTTPNQAMAIVHMVGVDKMCSFMAVDNEEVALATCNLFQCINDSLTGGDKREYGKEEALVLGETDFMNHMEQNVVFI